MSYENGRFGAVELVSGLYLPPGIAATLDLATLRTATGANDQFTGAVAGDLVVKNAQGRSVLIGTHGAGVQAPAMQVSGTNTTFASSGTVTVPGTFNPAVVKTRLRHTTFSCPSGIDTPIPYTISDIDTSDMWTSANNTRGVCKIAGSYVVTSNLRWTNTSTSTNERGIWHRITRTGGSTPRYASASSYPNASSVCDLSITSQVDLGIGDYIETMAFQATGAPLATSDPFNGNRMSIWRIGS